MQEAVAKIPKGLIIEKRATEFRRDRPQVTSQWQGQVVIAVPNVFGPKAVIGRESGTGPEAPDQRNLRIVAGGELNQPKAVPAYRLPDRICAPNQMAWPVFLFLEL